jgi:hypothetical protein
MVFSRSSNSCADQAVEIAPNVVQIFGWASASNPGDAAVFL